MSPAKTFEAPANRWAAFAVLLTASFMNVMDVTIVNVAMPTLKAEFNATPNKLEWVVAAYVFVFAIFLLPCGRLGDIYGKRRMFIWGVALFTFASGFCGMAKSIDSLIGARVLQGLGAAMMSPQAMALIPNLFPPNERGGAYSFFGLAAGLASVSGPIIGGLMIGGDILGLDWRPIFLVNVPIGVVTVVLALKLVPNVPGKRHIGNDYVGMVLAGSALFCVLLPLVEAPAIGWRSWMWPVSIAAPVLAIGFVWWESRQAEQGRPELVPIGLMRTRSFVLGASLIGLLFSGVPGFFMVMALYLQDGFGLSAYWSGLTVTPFSVGILLAAPISKWLSDRHLRSRIIVGALTLAIAQFAMLLFVPTQQDAFSWLTFAPALLFAGFGLGIATGPLFQVVLSEVHEADTGSASGASRAFQQVGAAFGIAIMGGIFFGVLGESLQSAHDAYTRALIAALNYTIAAFILLAACAFLLPINDRNRAS